ncbi:MAG: SCP2 sterol-binding domain-containing protein [Sandaracinaceae bacterium]
MHTDPRAFLRTDLPLLFNRAVEALRAMADGGNEAARARHADTVGARGVARMVLTGDNGDEVFLAVEDGVMRQVDAPPPELPLRMAVAAPAEAARAALEELDSLDALDVDDPPIGFAFMISQETQRVLDGHVLRFHVRLRDLPTDPEEVTLRVALGGGEPPAEPAFTATVSYDDLEDVANGDMTPQQLLGRLRLEGDASKAMALALTMAQRPRPTV